MLRYSLIFVPLLMGCSTSNPAPAFNVIEKSSMSSTSSNVPATRTSLTVSFDELLKHPEMYNGKRIRLSGTIASGGMGVGVLKGKLFRQQIQVGDIFIKHKIEAGSVIVEGIFDSKCVVEDNCTDFYSNLEDMKLISYTVAE